MSSHIITQEELNQLIDRLAQDKVVYAPVKDKEGGVWRPIKNSAEIYLDEVNTREPAKILVFPRGELMFEFQPTGVKEPREPEEQVVFGLRPCDARAIAFLRKFFTEEGKIDSYVQRRAGKSVFIGLACNKVAPTCFCVAVGGGPAQTQGLDLLLTKLDGKFLAEPLTARGEELVAEFPQANETDLAEKEKIIARVSEEIKTRIDTQELKKKLDNGFDHPVWEKLSFPCINCGACTFLCPTCHCFDVTDETSGAQALRIRIWDSCQFALYSRHASGHNPRLNPSARYRNRIMDKFKYTVEMVGEISCVGCGRCIAVCPAGIDIRETVACLLGVDKE
ncbi:MAG: 4Fe-4S dicluster domain-containing protein [candidate division WOR-3 bacterium]